MAICLAWVALVGFIGRFGMAQPPSADIVLMGYAVTLGQDLLILIVLFGVSLLRPPWIAALAGGFAVAALAIAWFASGRGLPAIAVYSLPLKFFVFGLVIAGAAIAAQVRNAIDAAVVVVTAILLMTLPGIAVRLMQVVLMEGVDAWYVAKALGVFFPSSFIPAAIALGLLGLYVPALLRRRERLRSARLGSHRLAPFGFAGTEAAALSTVARKLDDDALCWAYIWPDYTDAARNAIAEELERRGYARTAIETWGPDEVELTVPNAVEAPIAPDRYWALCRAKRRCFRIYPFISVPIFFLLTIAWMIAELAPHGNPQLFALSAAATGILILITVGLRFRARALRILLLRPFGEREMTDALKEFVCENIGPTGYVFTLSDRHYRPNLWLRLFAELRGGFFAFLAMYVIGPLLRNSRRIATVKSERTFRRLQKKLLRQLRPSFFSFLAGEQAFNIRSTDAWWQLCIRMLMQSCDVIVVDLSKIKAGTEWELKELHSRSLLEKCIFVAAEASCNDLERALGMHFERAPPDVFFYRHNGQLVAGDAAPFAGRLQGLAEASIDGWARAGDAARRASPLPASVR
jgi:hypothetical protein